MKMNSKNSSKTENPKSRILGKNFRWVVPKLDTQIWKNKDAFKCQVLDRIKALKLFDKGLKYYAIAIESHTDGTPHLDCLLLFDKRVSLGLSQLDPLCKKHGDLTKYRTLNYAILQYGHKEDTPLTNLEDLEPVLKEAEFRKDPFSFLMEKMKEDPSKFDFIRYCVQQNYLRHIKGWSSMKTKLNDAQKALATLTLVNKPGLRLINNQLIRERLSPAQYARYLSWTGYCKIVSYINQIYYYGYQRPFKSRHLLLVGPPNCGKTTLNRTIAQYVPTYEMGVSKWWPEYRDKVYKFFSWNELRLNVLPYPSLLKLFEGTPLDLEKKGDHAARFDNQLIIMNSNISYIAHLKRKFNGWQDGVQLRASFLNFPARVQELVIPAGYDLFLLLKLITPNGKQGDLYPVT